jgi:hypothetical protein
MISKISYDNDTVIKYAKELSYDFKSFRFEKNVVRYLPSITSSSNNIRRIMHIYKQNDIQNDGIFEWVIDNYHLIVFVNPKV